MTIEKENEEYSRMGEGGERRKEEGRKAGRKELRRKEADKKEDLGRI